MAASIHRQDELINEAQGGVMYYHVRVDMICHDGRIDMDARAEWDFRSLHKVLELIKRKFGDVAKDRRIQDLTERKRDVLELEPVLAGALLSSCQCIILSVKDGAKSVKEYDHVEFFVVARDESEQPPKFSFSDEDELAIDGVKSEQHSFVDLYKDPIDSDAVTEIFPLYDEKLGLFKGMVIQLKNGHRFMAFAGNDTDEKSFNLGLKGIDKSSVEKVLPSTPDVTWFYCASNGR